MTRTHLNELKMKMEDVLRFMKDFDDFASPVNHAAVLAMWNGKTAEQTMQVAVREYTGSFYRGRITGLSPDGHWTILAHDGELVPRVSADTFVAVRLESLP